MSINALDNLLYRAKSVMGRSSEPTCDIAAADQWASVAKRGNVETGQHGPIAARGTATASRGASAIARCATSLVLAGTLALSAFTLVGCASPYASDASEAATTQAVTAEAPSLTGKAYEIEKYGSAALDLSTTDMATAGFALGDTFDITFGNGFTLTDVPYFSGYYVKQGMPVLVAYPGNGNVLVAYKNAELWTEAGLEDGTSVTITLNTAGKEATAQETLGQSYSTDRADYASDEQFSNFRALSGGNLKENFLYRGASPVNNVYGRASTTDTLLEKTGIETVIDLADSDENMQDYFSSDEFSSPYAKSLYEAGSTVTLNMSTAYQSDTYKASVAAGVRFLLEHDGPAYIHCIEGKDRTGFVCTLLEALAGASYDEMCADYMATYDNYYGITKKGTPERYETVVSVYFDDFAQCLLGVDDDADLTSGDYVQGARNYLLGCGLTDTEIDQLVVRICK